MAHNNAYLLCIQLQDIDGSSIVQGDYNSFISTIKFKCCKFVYCYNTFFFKYISLKFLIRRPIIDKTMLTKWFACNKNDHDA
uniref:Uncharacterized protein n=1 Tax=Salix viminalis TaxID=40686 RepID=A0A6N2LJN3_SALVM